MTKIKKYVFHFTLTGISQSCLLNDIETTGRNASIHILQYIYLWWFQVPHWFILEIIRLWHYASIFEFPTPDLFKKLFLINNNTCCVLLSMPLNTSPNDPFPIRSCFVKISSGSTFWKIKIEKKSGLISTCWQFLFQGKLRKAEYTW